MTTLAIETPKNILEQKSATEYVLRNFDAVEAWAEGNIESERSNEFHTLVNELTSMGFTEEDCEVALSACNNFEEAVEILLSAAFDKDSSATGVDETSKENVIPYSTETHQKEFPQLNVNVNAKESHVLTNWVKKVQTTTTATNDQKNNTNEEANEETGSQVSEDLSWVQVDLDSDMDAYTDMDMDSQSNCSMDSFAFVEYSDANPIVDAEEGSEQTITSNTNLSNKNGMTPSAPTKARQGRGSNGDGNGDGVHNTANDRSTVQVQLQPIDEGSPCAFTFVEEMAGKDFDYPFGAKPNRATHPPAKR